MTLNGVVYFLMPKDGDKKSRTRRVALLGVLLQVRAATQQHTGSHEEELAKNESICLLGEGCRKLPHNTYFYI